MVLDKGKYISIAEYARFLGISRIAVYKKVKKGQIEAIKIGRSYGIPAKYVTDVLGKDLKPEEKGEIEKAVKRTVKEYGEVLKLLGKE